MVHGIPSTEIPSLPITEIPSLPITEILSPPISETRDFSDSWRPRLCRFWRLSTDSTQEPCSRSRR